MFTIKAFIFVAGLMVASGTKSRDEWPTLEACNAALQETLETDAPIFADYVAKAIGEGVPFEVKGVCVEKPKPEPKGIPA
jgi:hypothetical protein